MTIDGKTTGGGSGPGRWPAALRPAGGLALGLVLGLALMAGACAPVVMRPGEPVSAPRLADGAFHTADGQVLPVRRWWPEKAPAKAVIVALHGFNDYSNFFDAPGAFLAGRGVGSYAYDQRGFGDAPGRGLWPGVAAYTADLKAFAGLVKARHPGMPLYLLGESMGGAVIMVAAAGADPPDADGMILSAPAVWGRSTMPWYQRFALWLGAHLMPWAELTGQGLRITPSDNIEMLKRLGRDPKVIKATRVDAIWGLANLMDRALESARLLGGQALILYGEKDEIIPLTPTRAMLARLPAEGRAKQRVALYGDGYHMLLRDLDAETPLADIAHWIGAPETPLPSGADERAEARLADKATAKRKAAKARP